MSEIKSNWVTLKVADGTEMAAFVARPDGVERAPGLLVLQEAFGVNSHIQDVARRFAREGYLVISPELFHRSAPRGWTAEYGNFAPIMPHFQAMTQESLAADLRACYEWLKGDSQCTGSIGSVGYCMGGRASFVANGSVKLKAAVSYYGGRIAPDNLNFAASQSGPILLFWGGKDQHIGREQQNAVAAALKAAGKAYVDVEYSEADHAFFCDDRPQYNGVAARQSWVLTLAFFDEHLRG